MASKFGGVPVDDVTPSGSKFGGVAVEEKPTEKKERVSFPEKHLQFSRALTEGVLGLPGDIEAGFMNRKPTPGETIFPTSEEYAKKFTEMGLPGPTKQTESQQIAGHLFPAGVGLSKLTMDLGASGVTKATDLAKSFKKPLPIGNPEGYVSLGEKIENSLKGIKGEAVEARRAEAQDLYTRAKEIAREKQSLGEPFARSEAGRTLLNELEAEKYYLDPNTGQKFLKGEDKRRGIDQLINAIKGETTGGGVAPVGKGKLSSQLTKKLPSKTTEKDIDSVVEELRYLRDVNKPGKVYENYNALEAGYRKDLAKKIEQRLYQWSDEYRQADEAYKNASAKLVPFETNLMRRLLSKERLSPEELARDTESFAKDFFKSKDTVASLKNATNDPAFVHDLARDYFSTIFENKSPAEIKKFVYAPENQGWMQESGILQDAKNYANKAVKSESRQEIAKNIGKYTAIGALGYPVARSITSLFGF